MNGPYKFDLTTITNTVDKDKKGNYGLGYLDTQGTFIVKYVGRSDTDLQNELIARLEKGHPKFKYSYALSKEDAYRKECQNYHDFNPSENEIHPASPQGMGLTCSKCGK